MPIITKSNLRILSSFYWDTVKDIKIYFFVVVLMVFIHFFFLLLFGFSLWFFVEFYIILASTWILYRVSLGLQEISRILAQTV